MTEYAEFRLRIEPGSAPNTFRAESSGVGGERSSEFVLPFDDTQLENFVLKLGRTRRGIRKIESSETEVARTLGGSLFKAVMSGGIDTTFRDALGEARNRHQGLRITLSLGAVPRLSAIPWEFLFDDPDFLATSPDTPIVRFLDVARPHRPLQIALPLRILVVICSPTDYGQLNTGLERANLEPALHSLAARNAVTIDWLEHATLGMLNELLRSNEYHILHFIGHGGFDAAKDEGALLFEDEAGRGTIIGADRLATVLRSRDAIRLVVLNSCEGARSSIDDPFSGVAASLIERGFPAVIGMQFEISDDAAIKFSKEFYTVLAEGDPVDTAVAEARLAMLAERDDVEWGTPVLYMRVTDGRLFEISNAVPIPRDNRPEERAPQAAAEATPQSTLNPPSAPATPTLGPAVTVAAGHRDLTTDLAVEQPVGVGRIRDWFRSLRPRSWLLLAGGGSVAVVLLALLILTSSRHAAIEVRSIIDQPGYILVSGQGFRPGETVEVTVGARSTRTPVDATGSFNLPVSVGEGASGVVLAVGQISGEQGRAQFGPIGVVNSPTASAATPSPATPTPTEATSPSPSIVTSSCLDPGIRERSIVFYSNVDVANHATRTWSLYCIDPVTRRIGPVPMLNAARDDRPDTFATWSPTHDEIAFTRGSPAGRDILIRRSDSTIAALSASRYDDYFPAWSTDGRLAFGRGTGTNSAIMQVTLVTQDPLVTHDPLVSQAPLVTQAPDVRAIGRDLRAPAWSPISSQLAFFGHQSGNDYDIGVASNDPTSPDWILRSSANEMNPAWSNDEAMIAFVMDEGSAKGSDNDIYLMDVASRRTTRLTGLPTDAGRGVQDGNPVWSPDGQSIAFYRATPGGGFHIWTMNADGTNQVDLMPDRDGQSLDPNWR